MADAHLQPWLLSKHSLTQQLVDLNQGFRVQQVFQGKRKANYDEAMALGIRPGDTVFLREVLLYCGEHAVVFAHSITSMPALKLRWSHVKHLGSQSLGSLLFSNPLVNRTAFEYKKLSYRHALIRGLQAITARDSHTNFAANGVWARRSQFFMRNKTHTIMVTEVFLPALTPLLEQSK